MSSELDRLIRESLSRGDLDDCMEEMRSFRASIIPHLIALYPGVAQDVVEAVWDSGMECLLELIEEDAANGD